jgi:hypothetical protein
VRAKDAVRRLDQTAILPEEWRQRHGSPFGNTYF